MKRGPVFWIVATTVFVVITVVQLLVGGRR